jgi:hypothetical protein
VGADAGHRKHRARVRAPHPAREVVGMELAGISIRGRAPRARPRASTRLRRPQPRTAPGASSPSSRARATASLRE